MAQLVIKSGLDSWEDSAKDNFIAAKISKLTCCGASDITSKKKYLLNAFIKNHLLALSLKNESRQLMFSFIRKTEIAFNEYCYARESLINYFKTSDETVTPYFQSLAHFENCIMHLYQASDHFKRIIGREKLFEKDDGSFFQRLNLFYNQIKYIEAYPNLRRLKGEDSFKALVQYQENSDAMSPQDIGDVSTTALWITNEGLEGKTTSISFEELVGQIVDYYEEAEEIVTYDVSKSK